MFICPLSHLKVSAIADGEGLPQYKSIPEKCKSTDTKRAAFHKREAAFFRFFTESWGKSSLGARLRTRKVRGRDASLPAPLLSAFEMLVARGTVGALPQTPQGTLSLDPARGRRKGTKSPPCPLFAIELVALSYSFRVQLFGASPKPLFASPTFREEPLILRFYRFSSLLWKPPQSSSAASTP